jgi:uncharacterized protein (DUF1778 family)
LFFQFFVATIVLMMGRPPKPEDERKANVLRIRLTKEDRQALDRAASSQGQETSTWARDALLKLANRLSKKN